MLAVEATIRSVCAPRWRGNCRHSTASRPPLPSLPPKLQPPSLPPHAGMQLDCDESLLRFHRCVLESAEPPETAGTR